MGPRIHRGQIFQMISVGIVQYADLDMIYHGCLGARANAELTTNFI